VRAHLAALGPPASTAAVATATDSSPLPSGTTVLRVVTIGRTPVVEEVPALVVALASPLLPVTTTRVTEGHYGDSTILPAGVPRPQVSLVLDLDRNYLTGTVLADLADAHFPPGDADYRLAVVNGAGTTLFRRDVAEGAIIDPRQADVVVPFFSIRVEWFADGFRMEGARAGVLNALRDGPLDSLTVIQRRVPPGTATAVPAQGKAQAPVPLALTFNVAAPAMVAEGRPLSGTLIEPRRGWRLLIQHGAGSLDAAVSEARRRNLWLSFSILGVLATGIVIVMANARRSQQLASRQMDFVATVSHELRTPLAVIRSAAQNLSAGVVGDAAQARRYGTLIEDEGRRLTDMIEQVMDYAGLEGTRRVREPKPVDVPALVEQVTAACRSTCDAAGCSLVVDTSQLAADDVPVVMGDEGALGRVVTNLVTNAAKHGADGHWVGVTVSSCAVKTGREVLITVSDRGRGIDAADLAHVFEPFRRGTRAIAQQIHGNGLGLSLVKRIVDAHGGRVAVTSVPGEGATFVVYLPTRPTSGTEDVQ
jgi:signal transduction histidine kinase